MPRLPGLLPARGAATSHAIRPSSPHLLLQGQRTTGKPPHRCPTPAQPTNARRAAAVTTHATGAVQPSAFASISQQLMSTLPSSVVQAGPAGSVFSAITLLMVVVYSLMMLVPCLRLTRRIVFSPTLLGLMSVTCLVSFVFACQEGLLSSIFTTIHTWLTSPSRVPDFAMLAPLFNSPVITLSAWVHLLMLDFYVAREVFTDATIHSVPAAHSLMLCFFVGPIGLLCHAITRSLTFSLRKR